MKIRISNVSEDDFGLWRCLAKNSQGETSGEIKLYGMSMYDTSNYEAIAPTRTLRSLAIHIRGEKKDVRTTLL